RRRTVPTTDGTPDSPLSEEAIMCAVPLARVPFCASLITGSLAPPAAAKIIHVTPGQSIQAAVDRARAGDAVFVAPGTYRESGRPCPTERGHVCAVAITRDDVFLVGRGRPGSPVVLEAAPGQADGIAVGRTASPSCLRDRSKRLHGSLISGFEVRGFSDDGVVLRCVDHW